MSADGRGPSLLAARIAKRDGTYVVDEAEAVAALVRGVALHDAARAGVVPCQLLLMVVLC